MNHILEPIPWVHWLIFAVVAPMEICVVSIIAYTLPATRKETLAIEARLKVVFGPLLTKLKAFATRRHTI